ncbi:MAG: hypothetical protein IPG04_07505 [Polyangiaceae bacterium]|nr:hypothetical protein [Polyangiaceae bacterium]
MPTYVPKNTSSATNTLSLTTYDAKSGSPRRRASATGTTDMGAAHASEKTRYPDSVQRCSAPVSTTTATAPIHVSDAHNRYRSAQALPGLSDSQPAPLTAAA